MISIQNKVLQPYFAEAVKGDWFPPLSEAVASSTEDTLRKVINEAEAELERLGFAFPHSQNALIPSRAPYP